MERIAKDSDKDYWTILETLTAVVRAAPLREPPAASLYMDVQAILTVLARRKYHFGQGENQPLDFRGTDLRGANLGGAHLEGAILRETHLEGAILRETHLEGADLREAHLERADLEGARLEGADLGRAEGLTREQLVAIWMTKPDYPLYAGVRPEARSRMG